MVKGIILSREGGQNIKRESEAKCSLYNLRGLCLYEPEYPPHLSCSDLLFWSLHASPGAMAAPAQRRQLVLLYILFCPPSLESTMPFTTYPLLPIRCPRLPVLCLSSHGVLWLSEFSWHPPSLLESFSFGESFL